MTPNLTTSTDLIVFDIQKHLTLAGLPVKIIEECSDLNLELMKSVKITQTSLVILFCDADTLYR